jgi:IS1 family transposase
VRLSSTKSGPSWEKKQKRCDPANPVDESTGDQWDHVGIDAESRLVIAVVVGKRTGEAARAVVGQFADRTGNVPPALITTDDCNSYAGPLMEQYGELVVPERTGRPGRPRRPFPQWPVGSAYATVNKVYRKGKVASVTRTLVHGTPEALQAALETSPVSTEINTAFIERQNGTDRNYNARKARKTYEFSKDLVFHLAVTCWVFFCYNFHHLHRGLRQRRPDGSYVQFTPAMAAGLAATPWTVAEIITTQVVGFTPPPRATTADFGNFYVRGPAP